jgi:hypothetical protein
MQRLDWAIPAECGAERVNRAGPGRAPGALVVGVEAGDVLPLAAAVRRGDKMQQLRLARGGAGGGGLHVQPDDALEGAHLDEGALRRRRRRRRVLGVRD